MQEFENESGAAEAASRIGEFPIFHALSPPQNNRTVAHNPAPDHPVPDPSNALALPPPQLQPHIQPLVLGEGRIVPGGHNPDMFNENDNNNGPISPADLENIENNNAGEYIPNLNQILAPVVEPPVMQQPPPLLMQHQPLVFAPHSHLPLHINGVQGQANVSNSSFNEPPSPAGISRGATSLDMITINMPNNDTNPFLDNNETDMMVHLNDIRIDVDEECCTEVPLLGNRVSASASSRGIQSLFGLSTSRGILETEELTHCDEAHRNACVWNQPEISTNNEEIEKSASDHIAVMIASEEARGVEEALLALDFAISGADGQSDDEDDSETGSDVENEPFEEITPNNDELYTGSDNNQPIFNANNADYDAEFVEDVSKTAEQMVADVLEESLRRVYEQLDEQNDENPVSARCDNTIVIDNTSLSDLLPMDSSNLTIDHEVSTESLIDFNFEQLAIEASTPFIHKKSEAFVDSTFTSSEMRPKRSSQNLFGTVNPATTEAELNQTWCAPIDGNATFNATKTFVVDPIQVANCTFTAAPQDQTFNTTKLPEATFIASDHTFTAATDKTFPATDQTFTAPTTIDQTFTESPKRTHANLPEIRISTDSDVASVDLTTATPVNTPIELNYSVDGWDTFISNSMKKPLQLGHNDDDAHATATSLKPEDGSRMFAPAIDGAGPCGHATFAMDDFSSNGWSNDDDGMLDEAADDDQCEDGALLSLTFDSLRKQLTEALPHAQGSMSCSGGPADLPDEMGEVVDELLNNDFDIENR